MKAIILAAGFGTRLYPLTENKPKALLEVGGKTLLDHLMVKLESIKTIQDVVIVTNGRYFLDFFYWRRNAHYHKNIQIEANGAYTPEKREGAVRDLMRGMKAVSNSAGGYLVLCADNHFDFHLGHFLLPCLGHQDSSFLAVVNLKHRESASKYGVVELNEHGKITGFEEKPEDPKSTLVSTGIYFLPPRYILRVYEYLEIEHKDPDRMSDFIEWLICKETVYGVELEGTWIDIGDLKSYELALRSAGLGKKGAAVHA